MTHDTTLIDAALVESLVHAELVGHLEESFRNRDLDKVIDDPRTRQEMILAALADLLVSYGQTWAGRGAPTPRFTPPRQSDQRLDQVLRQLSDVSRYISLHLFDVLNYQRTAIPSVISDKLPADASWLQAYKDVEEVYRSMSDAARGVAQFPTLVDTVHKHLAKSPRHLTFSLRNGNSAVDFGDKSTIKFPTSYCKRVFRSIGSSIGSAREPSRLLLDTVDTQVCPLSFARELNEIIGPLTPAEASVIALAFYLWESKVGILPYYLRAYAWKPLAVSERGSRAERQPAVFILSCTLGRYSGREALALLPYVDALARGIASAITFFGLEIGRLLLPTIAIPRLFKHEIGGDVLTIQENILSIRNNKFIEDDLEWLGRELDFVNKVLVEIAEYPSLEQLLPDTFLIGREQVEMWRHVFEDLWRREYPAMDHVALIVSLDAGAKSIPFEKKSVELASFRRQVADLKRQLAELPWPQPLMFSRHLFRSALRNLISNANGASASRVEIRISPNTSAEGYVRVEVWDNGVAYKAPEDSTVTSKLGLRIVQRLVDSIAQVYEHTSFRRPTDGVTGQAKVFILDLPISRS